MAIIIIYDIPSKNVEFKKAMFQLRYKDQIPRTKNCKVIYFLNTTLYHATKEAAASCDDAQSICNNLGIKSERCVSTPWGQNWAAVCGEPFNS